MKTIQTLSLAITVVVASTQAWSVEPNVIRWSTASEKDNFGYEIYRGPTEDGPFESINAEPLQGAGTTDIPQKYTFTDDSIKAGTVYWYYVESISMDGTRKRLTPIYPSKPKFESEE